MGYSTEFSGEFKFSRELTVKEHRELIKMSDYNVEQPLYIKYGGKQPDSYNQWEPDEDGICLRWNGGEKFYLYEEWLIWLLDHYFTPHDITLSGTVHWQGEEVGDVGKLTIIDNRLYAKKINLDQDGEPPKAEDKPLKLYQLNEGNYGEASYLVIAHNPIEAAMLASSENMEPEEREDEDLALAYLLREQYTYQEVPIRAAYIAHIDWTEPEQVLCTHTYPPKKLNELLSS